MPSSTWKMTVTNHCTHAKKVAMLRYFLDVLIWDADLRIEEAIHGLPEYPV
jgi:hypothetical protein